MRVAASDMLILDLRCDQMDLEQMVIGLVMLGITVVLLVILTIGKSEPPEFLWAAVAGQYGAMFVARNPMCSRQPREGS